MKIAVSGIGVVSAAGIGVDSNIASMRNMSSGINGSPSFLTTRHELPAGEVKCSNDELKELLNIPLSRTYSRTALLGMLAARKALDDAGKSRNLRTGLISATSNGGMDLTEDFFPAFMKNDSSGRLRHAASHDCADSTMKIADYCNISDYVTTISTACSSAANAIMLGARLIRHGIIDRAVAGGTDALCRFTLNGFKSLMILDHAPCRPFDENRAGINLGEGAGYVVLQRADSLTRQPYCFITGYANANDAHHQTASSDDGTGAYLAMKNALRVSGLQAGDIGYINAHGTGTANNDLSEGIAIKRLFGGNVPPFSSTKAFTGHTLAASGGIEAVFAVLSAANGIIYPNLNFRSPMKELDMSPETVFREGCDLKNVMTNSFGFGGNCCSLIFNH